MKGDGLDFTRRRYIDIPANKAADLAIREGDFLISRANGSLALMGRACVAGIPPVPTVFPDTMIRFRLASAELARWAAVAWRSVFVREHLERRAKTSAGIWKISQDDMRSAPIPLPPSYEITAILEALATAQVENGELPGDGFADALRQSILHAAFTGRLVPQDPADEPAAALLARLAAMNLYLHGLGRADVTPIHRADALLADPGRRWDVVLTNPPFGRRQSIQVFTGDGEAETEREDYQRPDFNVTTGNKQLNFVQHIMTVLAPGGVAAVVLPDNVLFEGGAGEKIRRRLLDEFECHTLLRLPTGIFYRQGVKANVLFFEARPRRKEPWTDALWVYDLRTNKRFTLKERPLRYTDMEEFVNLAKLSDRAKRQEAERFKRFSYAELTTREKLDLNLSWLREEGATDPSTLPPPAEIAASIAEDLEAALARFRAVATRLG